MKVFYRGNLHIFVCEELDGILERHRERQYRETINVYVLRPGRPLAKQHIGVDIHRVDFTEHIAGSKEDGARCTRRLLELVAGRGSQKSVGTAAKVRDVLRSCRSNNVIGDGPTLTAFLP